MVTLMKKTKLIVIILTLIMLVAILFCLSACNNNDDANTEYEWIAGKFVKTGFWYGGMYVSEFTYEFTLNGGLSVTIAGIENKQ